MQNTAHHLLMGRLGTGDHQYLTDLSALVGTYDAEEVSHSQNGRWSPTQSSTPTVSRRHVQRPILPVADLVKTPPGQAVLVSHLVPWLLDMPGWWQVPWSRDRGWDPAKTPVSQLADAPWS